MVIVLHPHHMKRLKPKTSGRSRPYRRSATTLIELVVSMVAATVLMAGMASSIFIASQALDTGGGFAARRTEAARAQAKLTADLHHALSFVERTSEAVTFTVPDRDGDDAEETIRYAWSGLPDAQLIYSYNGSAAEAIAKDVQALSLSYLDRDVAGTQPPLAPEEWGNRWFLPTLGYDTVYANEDVEKSRYIATQATLAQNATLVSISAYLDANTRPYRFAIYTDVDGEPGSLIVQTDEGAGGGLDWHTLPTTPTPLAAGTYWLALAYNHASQNHFFEDSGGQTRYAGGNPLTNGFGDEWQFTFGSYPYKISIYGTIE